MAVRRTAAGAAAAGIAAVGLWPGTPAQAHGAPTDPLSRTAACAAGADTAGSAACRAALAANDGGFGNFDNLRVPGIGGRDRELIPDGRLCSAGLPDYRGLDLPRDDWPATTLTAGSAVDMRYRTTIPHPGSFRLFITKPGYDPQEPLTWDDLTARPLVTVKEPPVRDGSYRMRVNLPPNRTGRHLLYTVWQTTDSTDTYYSCSDLVLTTAGRPGPLDGDAAAPQPSTVASTASAAGGPAPTQPAAAEPAVAGRDAAAPGIEGGPLRPPALSPGPRPGPRCRAPVAGEAAVQPPVVEAPAGDDVAAAGTAAGQGAAPQREARLRPALSVAGESVSLGQQLVTASLVVLVGVTGALAFLRIRAGRAQRSPRRQKNR